MEIKIKFDSDYTVWRQTIIEGIAANNLVVSEKTIDNIYQSLCLSVTNYLIHFGYRPKSTLKYRKYLTKKWKAMGMSLSIMSNPILWQYLNWFTDVKNYNSCFDIDLVISDMDKACEDIIFVNVNEVPYPILWESKNLTPEELLTQKIENLKCCDEVMHNPILVEIVDILDKLNKKGS